MTDVPEVRRLTRPLGLLRHSVFERADPGAPMTRLGRFAGLLHSPVRAGQRPLPSFSYLVLGPVVLDERERRHARPLRPRSQPADEWTPDRPAPPSPTLGPDRESAPGAPDAPVRFRAVLRQRGSGDDAADESATGDGADSAATTIRTATALDPDDQWPLSPPSGRTRRTTHAADTDDGVPGRTSASGPTADPLQRPEMDLRGSIPETPSPEGFESADWSPTPPPSLDTPGRSGPAPPRSLPTLTPRRDGDRRSGDWPDGRHDGVEGDAGPGLDGTTVGNAVDLTEALSPVAAGRSTRGEAPSNGSSHPVPLTVRRSSTPDADAPRIAHSGTAGFDGDGGSSPSLSPEDVGAGVPKGSSTTPGAVLTPAPSAAEPAPVSLSAIPRDDFDRLVGRIQRELERAQLTERQRLGL